MYLAQGGKLVRPGLNEIVGYGRPASTPTLADMWQTWRDITTVADEFLDTLVTKQLTEYLIQGETKSRESVGTMLLRTTYHYWFHTGESHAVRQQLGHPDLPQFVGDMDTAVYRPEA